MAQTTADSGAISGTVTDSSGAVVPNASLILTSEKGITQQKSSGADGLFTFPILEPGKYTLTAEVNGFSKFNLTDILVSVTQVTRTSVVLQIGATSSEVSVTAEATQVQTNTSSLGNVLPGATIESLPLSTRNFTVLLSFNAGTAASLPDASVVGRGSSTIFVNGQRGTVNNLVINGVDANNLGNNNFGSVAIPAPDTIEEFRVQTSLYDASQGKSSGGNINVLTKGGYPQYHGELYEFFRNEDLNANSLFFNKNGVARPLLRQNQFGGNFGGPVPKLKNTFFFASYQGTRQLNGLSGAISTAFPVLPTSRDAASIGAAFGIAPSLIDPVTLKLLNAKGQYGGYLIPTGTGAAPGQFGQLNFSAPIKFNDDQFNANGDHNFGDRVRLSVRYFHAQATTVNPLGGQGAGNLGNGETDPLRNHVASVATTWSISSRAVNELRLGFARTQTGITSNEPVKLADVGMSRFNNSLYAGIPFLFTNDISPGWGGESTNYDQAGFSNTLNLADTFAYTLGKHTLRAGFEGKQYQINLFNNFASRGYLSFNTFNDFLRGTILQAFAGTGQTYRDFRAHDYSGFVQDDFKVTSNFTLNLGLRYDYLSPTTDKRNRVGNFDPNLLDAQTLASGGSGLLKGFILPAAANFGSITGTPGVSSSTFSVDNNKNFAPRVGFAWDPSGKGKTAVRGGYGMYYVRISNQTLLQLLTAAPFFQLTSVNSPGTSLSNPFPNLPVPSQFPIFPVTPSFTGFSATGTPLFSSALLALNPIQRNLSTPYAEHYNFSVQQQLPGNVSLELAYLGSQGIKLLQSLQVNEALLANAANPIRGLTANAAKNASARVGVVGFSTTGLNEVTGNGHSNYNALGVTLNRRFNAVFLQAAYTWSKSIDNNSGSATQDLGNAGGNNLQPNLLRSLSDFDRPHRLQVTYSYDLPGPKKGVLGRVAGGWNISGTTTYQSALPINFLCTCGSNNIQGITSTIYPNAVGDLSTLYKNGNFGSYTTPGTSIFNSGLLTVPASYPAGTTFNNLNQLGGPGTNSYTVGGPGTGLVAQPFGTLARNIGIRGEFQNQWDFALQKSFAVREKMKIQLRGEAFNLFNHAIYSAPNSTVGSASFGLISSTATAPRIMQIAAKVVF